ncbi:hypothetical protein SDC9_146499 [bioreactor metagenome]|uniref:Uncharacterized protein n=1 Tax=bioreactor metagenome TaxID=1076179 RepID=A0A645EDV6_9ZZZZ
MVGGGDSGDLVTDEILDEQDVFRLRRNLRLMFRDPDQLRQRPGRRRRLEGGFEDEFPVPFAQLSAFGGAALVGPHDGPADRAHRAVEQHRVVGGAVEGDRGGPGEVQPGVAQLLQRGAHRGVPVGRVLLGPAGVLVVRRVFARRFAEQPPFRIDRGDFAAAGAEIDSEQDVFRLRHHFTQPCCGSLAEISPRLTRPVMVQR